MAKARLWTLTDAEARRLGSGLDTPVVLAVNGAFGVGGSTPSVPKLALNAPPGEYGRKTKTSKKLTGPAQAVEYTHLMQREEPYLGLTCLS